MNLAESLPRVFIAPKKGGGEPVVDGLRRETNAVKYTQMGDAP